MLSKFHNKQSKSNFNPIGQIFNSSSRSIMFYFFHSLKKLSYFNIYHVYEIWIFSQEERAALQIKFWMIQINSGLKKTCHFNDK